MSQLLIGGGEVVAGGLVARDRPQRGVGARRVVGVQGAAGEPVRRAGPKSSFWYSAPVMGCPRSV